MNTALSRRNSYAFTEKNFTVLSRTLTFCDLGVNKVIHFLVAQDSGYTDREKEVWHPIVLSHVLEDMVRLATNNAKLNAEAEMASRMKDITGGLPLPPGMSLPF